ncbi:MAG: CusA/CzcA family heavy metal efflux RND transporter [Proteobacteria bacterium]|nr:CusA/CzcA family heavy metal efflux RND transporter [Pseudomonadota bacterium]MBU1710270.1 CusA/CzcA family heavy metal efflux RND transporter [Pseudomonadota bacterium]
MNKLIESVLKAPGLVIVVLLAVIGLGVFKYQNMPVDAFPDISPVMVPVFAEGHGMAPEEIERLITYPIESAMNGLPKVTQIKSTSAFGMAVVYVYFQDDVDIYFARQLVAERLAAASAELPEMDEPPALGPISTGLGQIFIYYLTADPAKVNTQGKDMSAWLREINDWLVKFQLQTVPGVTDVLSMGGHVLQYQVQLDPNLLRKYNLGLEEIVTAINDNNRNVGGQFLVLGSEEHLVRGVGLVEKLEDIGSIPVKHIGGTPVFLKDIAQVKYGNEIRRGVVTRNGKQEVVSGIVMKLYGENTSEVIERLYAKVESVKKSLPSGVTLVPYYEQAELVNNATGTVKSALWQGGLLVVLVLALFLGNWRTAFIVALSLPICSLTAIIFMDLKGISANLMSLGGIAIAIGMLGDGAIVMVENIYRHLGESKAQAESKGRIILAAAREVARPILFSIVIIVLVFLPLFTLEGVEGKMFSPMAFTISFALLGSLLVALLVAPVLSLYLLKPEAHKEIWLVRWCSAIYRPMLAGAYQFKKTIILASVVSLMVSLVALKFIGTEFIPTLEEGSILIGVSMAPSISLEEGTKTVMTLERKILEFTEVEETVSRIGRPEAGSHPHPVNTGEIHLELKPKKEWRRFASKAELIEAIREKISVVPGVQFNFTQPIQNSFDELLSGVKTQLAIKLFGEDLTILREKAGEIKEAIESVPGLVDLSSEQSFGQPQVQIIADREACARYGVSVSQILEMVELAVGGEVVDNIYLNTRRFGIHLRYQEPYRSDPEAIRNMLLATADKGLIPLGQVAEVKSVVGPIQINREKNQRRWVVQGNVRDRDIGSVVADIQQRIAEKVKIPDGYTIEYGGQFENQQRAMARLAVIVPIVILSVFLMLWMSFGSLRQAGIIMINVPLALVGGVLGLLIMGEYLSVPASVGFIALFGVAVQNGMVLVTYFNDLRERGRSVDDAVNEGALLRLRPVLMTAMTTILGLLPLLLASGAGSEVQRPLATVVVFGLATSTLLTLFVIPIVYGLIENKFEKRRMET